MNNKSFQKLLYFLLHNDWKVVNSALEGQVKHFKKEGCNRLVEVLAESLPGSTRSLESAVAILSETEGRDKEALSDLIFSKDPVLQIRVPEKTGEIPIDASIQLRQAAKQMIVAISHSIDSPQLEHPRLNARQALKRFKNCREKPSKESSYIARFLLPEELELATMTKNAIERTSDLARKDTVPTSSQHNELARNGVSANFLDAFSLLKGRAQNIEIAFSSNDSLLLTSINENFISFAKNLSSSLRAKDSEAEVEANGIITFLGWDDTDAVGSIKMRGNITSQKNNIDFIVQTDNTNYYEIARSAEYPTKKKIRLKGTYIPGTQPIRLANISLFETSEN
jgi:hypothetical protein